MHSSRMRTARSSSRPGGLHSDWKTWDNGKAFSSQGSQGIVNRLEKSVKITQNTGKLREFQINII